MLLERARDFVELLKNRGCITWNLSRWGLPAPYYDIADNEGGMWTIRTPQLLIVVHGDGGDRVLYKRILDLDQVAKFRAYILDDVSTAFHQAFRQGTRKCYERRGRKQKKEEGHE